MLETVCVGDNFEIMVTELRPIVYIDKVTDTMMGIDERVESFFSPRMRHHAGRPTTGHYTETMGINTYSQRETDNYTQTLDK